MVSLLLSLRRLQPTTKRILGCNRLTVRVLLPLPIRPLVLSLCMPKLPRGILGEHPLGLLTPRTRGPVLVLLLPLGRRVPRAEPAGARCLNKRHEVGTAHVLGLLLDEHDLGVLANDWALLGRCKVLAEFARVEADEG